jgi:RNA 3'-terminal phosphate cyclase (ATP)
MTLRGGTDAAFAPPIGYLQHVCLPTLQRLVSPLCLSLDLVRRGFFPKGGGELQLTVPPLPPGTALPAWQLSERGTLVKIRGWAVTAGKVQPDVGRRMAAAVRQQLADVLRDPAVVFGPAGSASGGGSKGGSSSPTPLKRHKVSKDSKQQQSMLDVVLDIQAIHEPPERAVGDGGSLVLVAETSAGCLFGASALAERGVAAEAVAAMAVRDLLEELRSGAAVDQW